MNFLYISFEIFLLPCSGYFACAAQPNRKATAFKTIVKHDEGALVYGISLLRHHPLMDSNKSNAFIIMLALSLVAGPPHRTPPHLTAAASKEMNRAQMRKATRPHANNKRDAGWLAGWSRVRICAKRNETTLGKLRPSFITGIII